MGREGWDMQGKEEVRQEEGRRTKRKRKGERSKRGKEEVKHGEGRREEEVNKKINMKREEQRKKDKKQGTKFWRTVEEVLKGGEKDGKHIF